MSIRNLVAVGLLSMSMCLSLGTVQAYSSPRESYTLTYTLTSTVDTLEQFVRALQRSYGVGLLSKEQMLEEVERTVKESLVYYLGKVDTALLTKLNSLSLSKEAKLQERLAKKLPKAIEQLTTAIDDAGLDKLDAEITVALRYVHDDLKVMPPQLEDLYQKVYAFAAAHPQEVARLGRGVRQLLIRLRATLVDIQRKLESFDPMALRKKGDKAQQKLAQSVS